MEKYLGRLKLYYDLLGEIGDQAVYVSEQLREGLRYHPMLTYEYLGKDIIAKARWKGTMISYNITYLDKVDPEYLKLNVMRHELTHATLLQWGLGYAYRDPYPLRFHENAAFYISGEEPFPNLFRQYDKEAPGKGLRLIQEALWRTKDGAPTAVAKNDACDMFGLGRWSTFQINMVMKILDEKYGLLPEELPLLWREIEEMYSELVTRPAEVPAVRHSDYLEWERQKKKRKKKKKG